MVRCMLHGENIELRLWGETVPCHCYIVNCSPTRALKDMPHNDKWNEIKPYVKHSRVFGCDAWVDIPNEER